MTLVSSEADISRFFTAVQRVDMREVSATQRPSTVWKVRFIINITFYVNQLLDVGLIGDGRVDLPNYIHNNRYIVRMDKSNGRVFEDKLCFFGV